MRGKTRKLRQIRTEKQVQLSLQVSTDKDQLRNPTRRTTKNEYEAIRKIDSVQKLQKSWLYKNGNRNKEDKKPNW